MKIVTTTVLIALFSCGLVIAQNPVEIWYGNIDGSPIEVQPGGEILVPVYIQTAPDVNLIYETILLGTDDAYVTDRLTGNKYDPLTTWGSNWRGPYANSPDPGVTSQECTGFDGNYNAPLHFETPTLILEYRMIVSSDEGLIGQTIAALLPGYNPNAPVIEERNTFFVGDDISTTYYPVEHYSMIAFVGAPLDIPTLSEWGMILFGLILILLLTVKVIRGRRKHRAKVSLFTIIVFLLFLIPFNPRVATGDPAGGADPPETMEYCWNIEWVAGDFNLDGVFNTEDFLRSQYWLSIGWPEPPVPICECCQNCGDYPAQCDVDANGNFNFSDVFIMYQYLRNGTPELLRACTDPVDWDDDGWIADFDCDDYNPDVYPGAPEYCDNLDNDCDDIIDEDTVDCPQENCIEGVCVE